MGLVKSAVVVSFVNLRVRDVEGVRATMYVCLVPGYDICKSDYQRYIARKGLVKSIVVVSFVNLRVRDVEGVRATMYVCFVLGYDTYKSDYQRYIARKGWYTRDPWE